MDYEISTQQWVICTNGINEIFTNGVCNIFIIMDHAFAGKCFFWFECYCQLFWTIVHWWNQMFYAFFFKWSLQLQWKFFSILLTILRFGKVYIFCGGRSIRQYTNWDLVMIIMRHTTLEMLHGCIHDPYT